MVSMLVGRKCARLRTDEVSVLEVEAVELVASRLGIHYVFIDNECCAFGVVGDALADLAAACQYEIAEERAWGLGRSRCRRTAPGRICQRDRRAPRE